MANKPIVARFPDGAEYGFDTPAEARKANADAVILRHQDGTEYVEPAPAKKAEKEEAK